MEHHNELETKVPEVKAPAPTNNLSIPIAIVIAGALIAGALYLSSGKTTTAPTAAENNAVANEQLPPGDAGSLDQMADISVSDHVRGNLDAPVKIVEYSDTECPFCKRFHPIMQQAVSEYDGQVAWVYRHFPLDSLHPKADKEAEATECANELGGPDKFWAYLDRLFEITPSNNNLDLAELLNIAEYIGLDAQKFNACLTSGKYAGHVEQDYQNALATGGAGTPWSIIITASGKKYPLSGAQPYESVKQLIDLALQDK
ncbi:TPA: hypothetical protein DIC39_01625 [Patescibacteria group bacterium]|nr:hypothetical protein [Patescibacteria group bacterium]HCU47741.1 hypothetical protein [Patescibacteria group bacterium]